MACKEIRTILWSTRSVLNVTSIKNTNKNNVRYMSAKRDRLYGVEEGHGKQKVSIEVHTVRVKV